MDPSALAQEILDAYANRRSIEPPSSRDGGFDLGSAYAVESEIVRLRRASGHSTAGLKVGFVNRAMWPALKLETVAWAHIYVDTVHYATANEATLPVSRMFAPKIEPEIVFKIRRPLAGATEPADVLSAIEWLALGFEIIDCAYPAWKSQPADFVACRGFHAALMVGEPLRVDFENAATRAGELSGFTVSLGKNGAEVAAGSGKNVLGSPALCLAELSAALSKHGAAPLGDGDLVTSGSLTDAQFIAPGETWTAAVEGLPLPALTLIVG